MNPTRRSLITGIGALLCAPAIVRASSIMPVKAFETDLLGFNAYEALTSIAHPHNPLIVRAMLMETLKGPIIHSYPTVERFNAGDLVYVGRDGYAYRHDSNLCPAHSKEWRNPFVGVAV